MLRDSIKKLMREVMKLRDIPLEIRDNLWRHQMYDLCNELKKIVGTNSFSYEGKFWRLADDCKSVVEVKRRVRKHRVRKIQRR